MKKIIRIELESKTVPLSEKQTALVQKIVSATVEILKEYTAVDDRESIDTFEDMKIVDGFQASDEEKRILTQQQPVGMVQAPDLTHTGGIIHRDGTRTLGVFNINIENGIESLPGWAFKKGDKFVGQDDARGFIKALLPAGGERSDQYLIHFYSPEESLFINKKIFEEEYRKLE